jgi:2-phosphoglycolate phosphatase
MSNTGFIFDFDGTLIDSTRDITRALNDVFEKQDQPTVTEAEVKEGIGHGARELVEHLLGVSPSDETLERMVEEFRVHYQSRCTESITPYGGIKPLLESLEGPPRAIVTNKPYDMTASILRELDWSDRFEPVYGADSHSEMKPSPEPLHAVQSAWEEPVDQTVMIGDNWTDVVAGQRAGMVTVACEYGFGDTGRLRDQSPDHVARTPEELHSILDELRTTTS